MKRQTKKSNVRITQPIKYQNYRVYVGESQVAGRGVFALMDFEEGDIIECAPLLKLEKCSELLYYTELKNYIFSHSDNEDDNAAYLGLGYTSLYNHAPLPNATFMVADDVVLIYAKKYIKENEEIFVNYGWPDSMLADNGIPC